MRRLPVVLVSLAGSRAARYAVERLVGISARRDPVVFSPRSLFEQLPKVTTGSGPLEVLYFAGCYAGYIRPEIGLAAVRTLSRLGVTVYLPTQHCCGLPLLSKGMADRAADKAMRNLERWGALARRVEHIVVTCSSCALRLSREWGDLAGLEGADTLAGKVISASALVESLLGEEIPQGPGLSVAYHQPCHLKIMPDPGASLRLLARLPAVEVTNLDSHCCGMAGSWGMKAGNYDLSRRIATDLMRRLADSKASVAVTDCPTCRMQMEQFGRTPIRHPMEIAADYLCP
jgi:Fe-S oxidoreductase